MESGSVVAPMDSYLIHSGEKSFIYVSSIEMPILVSNKKLPIRSFEIKEGTIVPRELPSEVAGFHVRNIFQAKPAGADVYFVDHGIDVEPFPGGSVFKYCLEDLQISSFHEHDAAFNFAGNAVCHDGVLYEVFVGINYVTLYRDGIRDDRMDEVLKTIKEPQGFLSSTFFTMDNELCLFLGVSDISHAMETKPERYDYVLVISNLGIEIRHLVRPVPWDWATVYSEIDETVAPLGSVLKVAYHNPGFNAPRLGYYQLTQEFKFREIPLPETNKIQNNWVPKFELGCDVMGKVTAYAPVRAGSSGGRFGLLVLPVNYDGEKKFDDLCLVGVHKLRAEIFGLTFDLKFINIEKRFL